MKSVARILLGLAAVLVLGSFSRAEVLKIVVDDTIQPITEEYISRAIDEAKRRNDQAVLIEINTPGGLVDSTRKIIENITSSRFRSSFTSRLAAAARGRLESLSSNPPISRRWLPERTRGRRIPW